MRRRAHFILSLLILFVLFAAAMLLLHFRVMRAQMSANKNVATYSFGLDEGAALPLAQDIDLYLEAPWGLEAALADALQEALKDNPYVRDVNLEEGPPAPAPATVLVVGIDEPSVLFWSPFYTRSDLTVAVAYASDGEVGWIDEEVVALSSEDGVPVVRFSGEYRFDGTAYGLISGPGYANYLANQIADAIDRQLADSLATPLSN